MQILHASMNLVAFAALILLLAVLGQVNSGFFSVSNRRATAEDKRQLEVWYSFTLPNTAGAPPPLNTRPHYAESLANVSERNFKEKDSGNMLYLLFFLKVQLKKWSLL